MGNKKQVVIKTPYGEPLTIQGDTGYGLPKHLLNLVFNTKASSMENSERTNNSRDARNATNVNGASNVNLNVNGVNLQNCN